jgi:hypothetical protein
MIRFVTPGRLISTGAGEMAIQDPSSGVADETGFSARYRIK